MSVFEKFAKKYFEEALKDLERCRRALAFNDYPQAVFYAQQCVEKCVKALLEIRRRVVYNHGPELITAFYEVFKDKLGEGFNIVVEALEYLTEYYARARYLFLLRGEIFGPEDIVTKEVTEKVVEVTRNYLRGRDII
jgi:HEPN domain-containing protein